MMHKIKKRAILFLFIFLLMFCYQYSPYKIEFLNHYHKIWAHRVNSLEKLRSSVDYFVGLELDLVYVEQKDYFDINHPPSKSIGLTFESYLSEIDKETKPHLWLDIKNLKKDNAKKVLHRLLCLFEWQ